MNHLDTVLLLVVATLATTGQLVGADSFLDGAKIVKYPVDPKDPLHTDYHNLHNFFRKQDGSIDLKVYQQFIITKYLETQSLLEKICAVDDMNGCQPYRQKASRDMLEFFKELGQTVKFFDGFLVRLRKIKARQRERRARERAQAALLVANRTTTRKPRESQSSRLSRG